MWKWSLGMRPAFLDFFFFPVGIAADSAGVDVCAAITLKPGVLISGIQISRVPS